jgi:hypothetical protein
MALYSQTIIVADVANPFDPRELDEVLALLTPFGLLEELARIAVELAELPYEQSQQYQLTLLDRYAPNTDLAADMRTKIESGAASTITTSDQVANLLLYVIATSGDVVANRPAGEFPRDGGLIKALIQFNRYGLIDPNSTQFFDSATSLGTTFAQLRSSTDRFLNVAYRYMTFLDWSESAAAQAHVDALPLVRDLERALGMPYTEYVAAAWLADAYFSEGRKLSGVDYPWLHVEKYAPTGNVNKLVAYLEMNSFGREDLRHAIVSDQPREFCRNGYTWLLKRPLYNAGGRYLLASKSALENTVGAGLYYKLFQHYKDCGMQHQHLQLTRFFGTFFEEYVWSLISRMAAATGGRAHREIVGRGMRSTDVVLFEDDVAVFFEVFSGRVPTDVLVEMSEEKITAALQKSIFKKAKQLHDNIDRFRTGGLRFPDVDADKIRSIYPVIVLPAAFPRSSEVQTVIDNHLRACGLLTGVRGLEVIESETLEGIEEHVHDAVRLHRLIDAKLGDPVYRASSFKNFLIGSDALSGLRIGSVATKRLDRWIGEVIAVVKQWFPREQLFY